MDVQTNESQLSRTPIQRQATKQKTCELCHASYVHFDAHLKEFPCTCLCEARLLNECEYRQHILTKTLAGDLRFMCCICGTTYSMKRDVKSHFTRKHGASLAQYICQYCEREFRNFDALVSHRTVNIPRNPYKCQICHACFLRESCCIPPNHVCQLTPSEFLSEENMKFAVNIKLEPKATSSSCSSMSTSDSEKTSSDSPALDLSCTQDYGFSTDAQSREDKTQTHELHPPPELSNPPLQEHTSNTLPQNAGGL